MKRERDAAGPPAWVIVLDKWLPMNGWNWTLYRGGRCADEGFQRTKKKAERAAREAIREAVARDRAGRRGK